MRSTWKDYSVPHPELLDVVREVPYAENATEDQFLYMGLPKGKKNVPLVIFFHGGGMTGGERECPADLFLGEYAVAEPRYRLSPAYKAPVQMEDAARAVAWCFEHAAEYGFDRNRIFVGGMSAGAYLAAITVMNPKFLAPYGLHYRDIAGLLLISGQMTTHFQIKVDLGRANGTYNPLVDEYAPLGNLAADLPPILMVTGDSGFDIPVRPEENAFMAASLKAMGHPDVQHYALAGHHHGGAFESCDFLAVNFLARISEKLKKKEAVS